MSEPLNVKSAPAVAVQRVVKRLVVNALLMSGVAIVATLAVGVAKSWPLMVGAIIGIWSVVFLTSSDLEDVKPPNDPSSATGTGGKHERHDK